MFPGPGGGGGGGGGAGGAGSSGEYSPSDTELTTETS